MHSFPTAVYGQPDLYVQSYWLLWESGLSNLIVQLTWLVLLKFVEYYSNLVII